VRLLAVVATEQERAALLRSTAAAVAPLGPYRCATTAVADVLVSGIGPAASAACAATALALRGYDLALSVGVCGAFRGTAEVGDTVVATELVAADLGADSPEGYLGTSALGWAEDVAPAEPRLLRAVVGRLPSPVTGPVLTVSTVTGTRVRADLLAERHGPVAEAMEGWGVLTAARLHGVPVLEVRTVSNLVDDRDTSTWSFPRAFDALAGVGSALLQEVWWC